MTKELERRWREGMAPFSGQTLVFASDDLTPLPALRLALLALVSRLRQFWPEAVLFIVDDWWEHDGFGKDGSQTSWPHLFSQLVSEETMLALSHEEWNIRKAFFPSGYDFYLRVYIPSEDDNDYPERRGDFDVTCSSELAAELAELAASASGLPMVSHNAQEFFARRYDG